MEARERLGVEQAHCRQLERPRDTQSSPGKLQSRRLGDGKLLGRLLSCP